MNKVKEFFEAISNPQGLFELENLPDNEFLKAIKANKNWLDESFIIATQILGALEKRGWTKEDLAKEMVVPMLSVEKYLSGKCKFSPILISYLENILDRKLGKMGVSSSLIDIPKITLAGDFKISVDQIQNQINTPLILNPNIYDGELNKSFINTSPITGMNAFETFINHDKLTEAA